LGTNDTNATNGTNQLLAAWAFEWSCGSTPTISEYSMRGELLEAKRVHSIVGGFFAVYNYYGYGLSEQVYAGALEHELRDRGHEIVRELVIAIDYQGRYVARQRLDMVVKLASSFIWARARISNAISPIRKRHGDDP
jgi:hypothetical protein